mgnify:CR=1 FL=1
MNTGFLNRRRVLLGAQILCLTAVAAIFVVSPFVALAGCGNNGKNNVNVVKNLSIVGITPQVTKSVRAGTNVLNAAIPGTPAGIITPKTAFTLKDLAPGAWITGIYKGVLFQGTVFKVSVVNNNEKVAEVWVADPAQNTKGVKPGLIVKNVSLKGIPAA